MNKKYLLYVAVPVAAVALAGIVAVGSVSAANSTSVSLQGPMSSLVDAIAKRFNLNPTDVQKVVSEQKTTMQAAMEQKYADHIAKAVADGSLTQDQANKILAKKAELEASRATTMASLQGKSRAEVEAFMKTQMDSLKQWASDNSIPLQYVMFGGFNMGKGHMGPGFGGKMFKSPTK